MINKREYRLLNNKKVLRKHGKQWLTVSIALLGTLGLGGAVSHTAHADTLQAATPTAKIQANSQNNQDTAPTQSSVGVSSRPASSGNVQNTSSATSNNSSSTVFSDRGSLSTSSYSQSNNDNNGFLMNSYNNATGTAPLDKRNTKSASVAPVVPQSNGKNIMQSSVQMHNKLINNTLKKSIKPAPQQFPKLLGQSPLTGHDSHRKTFNNTNVSRLVTHNRAPLLSSHLLRDSDPNSDYLNTTPGTQKGKFMTVDEPSDVGWSALDEGYGTPYVIVNNKAMINTVSDNTIFQHVKGFVLVKTPEDSYWLSTPQPGEQNKLNTTATSSSDINNGQPITSNITVTPASDTQSDVYVDAGPRHDIYVKVHVTSSQYTGDCWLLQPNHQLYINYQLHLNYSHDPSAHNHFYSDGDPYTFDAHNVPHDDGPQNSFSDIGEAYYPSGHGQGPVYELDPHNVNNTPVYSDELTSDDLLQHTPMGKVYYPIGSDTQIYTTLQKEHTINVEEWANIIGGSTIIYHDLSGKLPDKSIYISQSDNYPGDTFSIDNKYHPQLPAGYQIATPATFFSMTGGIVNIEPIPKSQANTNASTAQLNSLQSELNSLSNLAGNNARNANDSNAINSLNSRVANLENSLSHANSTNQSNAQSLSSAVNNASQIIQQADNNASISASTAKSQAEDQANQDATNSANSALAKAEQSIASEHTSMINSINAINGSGASFSQSVDTVSANASASAADAQRNASITASYNASSAASVAESYADTQINKQYDTTTSIINSFSSSENQSIAVTNASIAAKASSANSEIISYANSLANTTNTLSAAMQSQSTAESASLSMASLNESYALSSASVSILNSAQSQNALNSTERSTLRSQITSAFESASESISASAATQSAQSSLNRSLDNRNASLWASTAQTKAIDYATSANANLNSIINGLATSVTANNSQIANDRLNEDTNNEDLLKRLATERDNETDDNQLLNERLNNNESNEENDNNMLNEQLMATKSADSANTNMLSNQLSYDNNSNTNLAYGLADSLNYGLDVTNGKLDYNTFNLNNGLNYLFMYTNELNHYDQESEAKAENIEQQAADHQLNAEQKATYTAHNNNIDNADTNDNNSQESTSVNADNVTENSKNIQPQYNFTKAGDAVKSSSDSYIATNNVNSTNNSPVSLQTKNHTNSVSATAPYAVNANNNVQDVHGNNYIGNNTNTANNKMHKVSYFEQQDMIKTPTISSNNSSSNNNGNSNSSNNTLPKTGESQNTKGAGLALFALALMTEIGANLDDKRRHNEE